MSILDFNQMCSVVTQAMTSYVNRFVTPLSVAEEYGKGYAFGSGTYVQGCDERIWVLTAAHVITGVPKGGRLAHLPQPGGQYTAGFGTPVWKRAPVDVGALPVVLTFPYCPADERLVQPPVIAPRYQPVQDELLFWFGYPSFRLARMDVKDDVRLRAAMFGELDQPAKPMLSQALPYSDMTGVQFFDPTFHVGLHYPEFGSRATDLEEVSLAFAEGMSGSALWDTKAVACLRSEMTWGPEMAKICGVVRAAHTKPVQVVTATKIEHVRAELPEIFAAT